MNNQMTFHALTVEVNKRKDVRKGLKSLAVKYEFNLWSGRIWLKFI